jgi:predicted glycogen debranching enzyme
LTSIELQRDAFETFDAASGREWLLTNGLGGFASGTVSGARTRRYHGLLVPALSPPADRVVMVAKADVLLDLGVRRLALTSNEFADGTLHPTGHRTIDRFRLEDGLPVWRFVVEDAVVEQRLWMAHGRDTTFLRLTLTHGRRPVAMTIVPLCTFRDFHGTTRGGRPMDVWTEGRCVRVVAFEGARPFRILADRGDFVTRGDWHWGFRQRAEAARGLDDIEDLFCPAELMFALAPGESVTITFTAEEAQPGDADAALAAASARARSLLGDVPASAPEWIRQLHLAADQFLVERRTGDVTGSTVIAGYPWFGDWGRDTMIALPGLALVSGRYHVAADVLRTFAAHVSMGMLPNRFPDRGDVPEYNTVDATLWYFQAIDQYLQCTGDRSLVEALYPVLTDIIEWHVRGTRYGIRMDDDGLLSAGEPGVQLTWMDARVDGRVITPRHGKAVEINALWYCALITLQNFATLLGDGERAVLWREIARKVAATFARRFWNPARQCLFDVVDGPEGDDASLRPNQVLAIALAPELLGEAQARAVLDVCAQTLWTPVGLRSLAPGEPGYAPHYRGGPGQRDAVYHQGTVWAWLLGPFALAHFRVHGDAAQAQRFLEGIAGHLRQGCVGSVSEIFDAEAPHEPAGCFSQAWSVAEVLRAWLEIERESKATAMTEERSR